jgi:hypothetical protein
MFKAIKTSNESKHSLEALPEIRLLAEETIPISCN